MNPLVQDMLNTVAGQDTELVFLEGLLEDDCKCESRHTSPENRYCSATATFTFSSCTPTIIVCDAAGQYGLRAIREDGDWLCEDCDLTVEECWTIRPI